MDIGKFSSTHPTKLTDNIQLIHIQRLENKHLNKTSFGTKEAACVLRHQFWRKSPDERPLLQIGQEVSELLKYTQLTIADYPSL